MPLKIKRSATEAKTRSLLSPIQVKPGILAYIKAMAPPAPIETNKAGRAQHNKVPVDENKVKYSKNFFTLRIAFYGF